MIVRIVAIDESGIAEVVHDGTDHRGFVDLSDIPQVSDDVVGQVAPALVVACPAPGCVAETTHPFSGGAEPESVQRAAVLHRVVKRDQSFAVAWASVGSEVARVEPGRFRFAASAPEIARGAAIRLAAKARKERGGR